MIEASAPVRICDLGGWTDTWFGGPGRIVSVAVNPGVEVCIRRRAGRGTVVLDVTSFGHRYRVDPGVPRTARHPLLEAAIDRCRSPLDPALEITVGSAAPPGCGTGTSAAVTVALLGALGAAGPGPPSSPLDTARAAHRLEVSLDRESGVQDQLAAALGGINHLRIEPYPDVRVEPLPAWDELGQLLTVVYLGHPHRSSEVHRQVIADARHHQEAFSALRRAAADGRQAVLDRDPGAFGRAMVDNTEAQRSLHPGLVGTDAQRVIGAAEAGGALGWKVNGAGGDGGSVTVLSATAEGRAAFEQSLARSGDPYRVLPVGLAPVGLRVAGSL